MTVLARRQWSWCYAQRNLPAIDSPMCPCRRDYLNTTQGIIVQGMWTLRWIYRSCRIKCERGFVRLYQVFLVTYPEALVTHSVRDNVLAPESAKLSGTVGVNFLHNEAWPLECNAFHETQLSLLFTQVLLKYIGGLRRTRWQGSGKDYTKRSFLLCIFRQI
jgi:hypothetical protein